MFLSFVIGFKGLTKTDYCLWFGGEGCTYHTRTHTSPVTVDTIECSYINANSKRSLISLHTTNTYADLHFNALAALRRTSLSYEYVNRLMLQIYVPINGVLEGGVDIPNTSASWQGSFAGLHSWHLRFFFPSSSLFLMPRPRFLLFRKIAIHYVNRVLK